MTQKRTGHKSLLKPACCWLLSVALVFSMGAPAAYAAPDPTADADVCTEVAVEPDTQAVETSQDVLPVPVDEAAHVPEATQEADAPDAGQEPPAFAPYIDVIIVGADGMERAQDDGARVGDTVYLTLNLQNTGTAPAEGVTVTTGMAGLVAQDGPWGQACTVAAGDMVCYTAAYEVGEDAPEVLELTAVLSMPGSPDRYYSPRLIAVTRPAYRYVINYYKDEVDASMQAGEGNFLGSYEGESPRPDLATLPDELLNAQLPAEGYEPLTADDFVPCTLAEDQSTTIDLVYRPATPEPDDPPVRTAPYVVYYYTAAHDGAIDLEECTPCGIYKGTAQVGTTVTLAPGTGEGQLDYCLPARGYKPGAAPDGRIELVVGEEASANVLRVVYTPLSFAYGVTFYCEGTYEPLGRIEGTAPFGSTVHISADELNQYLPELGYLERGTGLDLVIDADEGRNEAYITYERASYRYTVNYYRDSVSEDNRIGTPYVAWGKYGQTVYNIPLNIHCPDGYRQIEDGRSVTITADEAQNVVNIVYERRDDIGYTVNYYQDGILDGVLLGTDRGTGTLGQDIPHVAGKYCPAGYDSNAELQGVKVICAYESSNVLNVVYVRKASYAYEVRYYRDSVSPENMIGAPVTGTAPYQSVIPYDVDLRVPAGYTSLDAQISGAQMVGSDERNNVLNIVYSKDDAISYTVNYYLGSLDGERVGQVRGAGTFEAPIPYDVAAYLRPGYSGAVQLSGATSIGADAAANVLDVVLPRAAYAYTVNYYVDAIAEENLIDRERGSALYLTELSYDIAGHAPEGYDPQAMVTGSAIVSYDADANVLNVVYRRALFGYTVNYYGGGISQGQLLTSVTYEPRSFGSSVELTADELNARRPQGYAPLGQGVSIVIGTDVAANVANVVFYPDFSDFYAAGISSLDAIYDGSAHYVTAQGVVNGDIVTYAYNGALQTRIVGADANIGVGFSELTDGELPVLVTVTRGGITSNALRTSVRIGPAPVPVPDDPAQSEQPQPIGPPADEQPANPLPDIVTDVLDTTVAAIGPALVTVGEALDLADMPQAQAATIGPLQTTIDDETNPLAGPNDLRAQPMTVAGVTGYVLMLLAAVCMLAAIALLVVRRRLVNRMALMKTSEAVIHRVRVTKVTRGVVALFVAAIVFCALWGVFLI